MRSVSCRSRFFDYCPFAYSFALLNESAKEKYLAFGFQQTPGGGRGAFRPPPFRVSNYYLTTTNFSTTASPFADETFKKYVPLVRFWMSSESFVSPAG